MNDRDMYYVNTERVWMCSLSNKSQHTVDVAMAQKLT